MWRHRGDCHVEKRERLPRGETGETATSMLILILILTMVSPPFAQVWSVVSFGFAAACDYDNIDADLSHSLEGPSSPDSPAAPFTRVAPHP